MPAQKKSDMFLRMIKQAERGEIEGTPEGYRELYLHALQREEDARLPRRVFEPHPPGEL